MTNIVDFDLEDINDTYLDDRYSFDFEGRGTSAGRTANTRITNCKLRSYTDNVYNFDKGANIQVRATKVNDGYRVFYNVRITTGHGVINMDFGHR